jgi:ketosteroid isomerase-like protein
MGTPITAEEVHGEVQRFWNILSGKSGESLEQLYSPTALVFTGKAKRSEVGRFAAVRRIRQLARPNFAASTELDAIEVQIAGPDVAIATYTYRFYFTRTDKEGGREQRSSLSGRSTQIFQRDDRGALKIVHEHLSSVAPPKVEKDSPGEG